MPKSRMSRPKPRSPDPAWGIEFEPVLGKLPHPQHLAWQLLQEFRRVPDPYKPEAIDQVRLIARLTKWPTVNRIGDEDEKE